MSELYMIPVILIGTIWGAIGVVLKAFEIIIIRRDNIIGLVKANELADKSTSNDSHRESGSNGYFTIEQEYWNTLFPISFGISLFLAIVTLMLWILPVLLLLQYYNENDHWKWILILGSCCVASLLPFISCVGFLRGAMLDYRIIILPIKNRK